MVKMVRNILRYCPFKGHVALGGGGLALFDVGCLWTWPTHLTQVQARLTDKVSNLPSVAEPCNFHPWHFGVDPDPDPRIHASD